MNTALADSTPLLRYLAEGLIRDQYDIGRPKGAPFQEEQDSMKNAAATKFCFEDFGRDIVLVKDVLLPKELEWQGNQENIVRRIAALNNVETSCQEDSPCEQILPKKGICIFKQIAKRPPCLDGRGMAKNADALEPFESNSVRPANRTDDGNFIAGGSKRLSLLPDPSIERDRQILYDDKNTASFMPGIHDANPLPQSETVLAGFPETPMRACPALRDGQY
jgi:hypothetical protein